jgi:Na+/H+ antiporter NhaD/arsenite permease-like protein
MNATAVLASLIFIVCLILIFTEVINSTIVAFAGATLMLVL